MASQRGSLFTVSKMSASVSGRETKVQQAYNSSFSTPNYTTIKLHSTDFDLRALTFTNQNYFSFFLYVYRKVSPGNAHSSLISGEMKNIIIP